MKSYLLEQFNTAYDTDIWFVSFKSAVQDLNEEQALYKTAADVHSVYELVTHLCFWNERYLQKLKNESPAPIYSNEVTFENKEALSWDALLIKTSEVFAAWQNALTSIADETLQTNDWKETIGHLTTHNAYHVGQIVLLRKLQGNWDKTKGIS